MKNVTTIIVSSLLLILCGCTSGEKASPPSAGSPNSMNGFGAQGKADKGKMIQILPTTPTVQTDLQVLLSGMENAIYQWEKNGEILGGEDKERLLKNQFAKGDMITVRAIASTGTISTSVIIANSRPKVTALSLSPQNIYRGTDITAVPTGFDADGDFVQFNYRWLINDQEVSSHDDIVRGDKFRRGDVLILEVVAYDNEGEGEVSRTVPLVIPNAPPKFVSLSLAERSSNTYVYNVKAEDPDGDTITYMLSNPPKGMVIDASTGQITWQITAKDDAGKREVEIVAQDEMGLKTSQKFMLEVTIPDEGQK